jgi:hypothetical protein
VGERRFVAFPVGDPAILFKTVSGCEMSHADRTPTYTECVVDEYNFAAIETVATVITT